MRTTMSSNAHVAPDMEHPSRQLSICHEIIYTFQYSDSAGKFIVNMHAVLMNMNMRKLLCQRRRVMQKVRTQRSSPFSISLSVSLSLFVSSRPIYLSSFSLFLLLFIFLLSSRSFSKTSILDFTRINRKVITSRNRR